MECRGYLQFKVYQQGGLIPINDAKVVITQRKNEKIVFYEVLKTDKNGITRKALVNVPDLNLSLIEQYKEKPYETYDVMVEALGYLSTRIIGIQAFYNTTSIQKVEMNIEGFHEKNIIDVYKISEHNLYKNLERSENKKRRLIIENNISINLVIPENIVIHLGKPYEYAQNVVVNFIDYVKNVISNKVYPTWPLELIKANIYNIISFILNRVYNKWYRSQGYDFDVSNDYELDEKFICFRNTFENIDDIVDRCFNEYINTFIYNDLTLEDSRSLGEVLIYKDISWEALPLLKKGYRAIDIIREYYGKKVAIERTCFIDGIKHPYIGKKLSLGNRGACVKFIKFQMSKILEFYKEEVSFNVNDDDFDNDTEKALNKIKEYLGMNIDGIIDESTWYKISYIYLKLKNYYKTSFQLSKVFEENLLCVYPGFVLKEGMRGEIVKDIQYYLHIISEKIKSLGNVIVDGDFEVATKNSVIKFQKYFGLNSNGEVDKITWNKIYNTYSNIYSTYNNKEKNIYDYPKKKLKVGDSGFYVNVIQFYLQKIERLIENMPKINIDGLFGKNTEEAIKKFQKEIGVSSDGIVDLETWNEMRELYIEGENRLDNLKELRKNNKKYK